MQVGVKQYLLLLEDFLFYLRRHKFALLADEYVFQYVLILEACKLTLLVDEGVLRINNIEFIKVLPPARHWEMESWHIQLQFFFFALVGHLNELERPGVVEVESIYDVDNGAMLSVFHQCVFWCMVKGVGRVRSYQLVDKFCAGWIFIIDGPSVVVEHICLKEVDFVCTRG